MSSDHRRHDRLLIARYAADDPYPGEADEARDLIATCSDCAALASDINSISAAVGRMPALRRPRDFRLSADQAERLRGSWLERLMRRLASPGWATLRPVAGVAMSIGIALLVVGALPAGMPLAASPLDDDGRSGDQPAAVLDTATPTTGQPDLPPQASGAPQATADALGPELFPTTIDDPMGSPGTAGNGSSEGDETPEPGNKALDQAYVAADPDAEEAPGDETAAPATSVSGRDLIVYGGLVLAIGGFGLLLLIMVARRRYSDPLR